MREARHASSETAASGRCGEQSSSSNAQLAAELDAERRRIEDSRAVVEHGGEEKKKKKGVANGAARRAPNAFQLGRFTCADAAGLKLVSVAAWTRGFLAAVVEAYRR